MKDKIFPAVLILVILLTGWFLGNKIDSLNLVDLGSVSVSDEYSSVLTGGGSGLDDGVILKGAQGVLGSVVITGAAAGALLFYNATTSDVTLRAGATSTLELLADIPKSTVAGTYTFDIVADIGLLLVMDGTQPTSTVTYR